VRRVELKERDQPKAGDDDGAAAESDDAEDSDLASRGHVQIPDGGDGEEKDIEVLEDVLCMITLVVYSREVCEYLTSTEGTIKRTILLMQIASG
jgi:hypothetical protein